MTTQYNARALSAPTLESITDAALKFLVGNRVMASAAVAIGSTASQVATGAFTFMIGGQIYSKTAVAAGTAFTDVTPQPANTTAMYLLAINAAGTITIINGEPTPIVDGQPSDLRVPACPLDHAPLGAVKVVTTAAFIPATTLLSAGTVTDTYYSFGCALRTVVG